MLTNWLTSVEIQQQQWSDWFPLNFMTSSSSHAIQSPKSPDDEVFEVCLLAFSNPRTRDRLFNSLEVNGCPSRILGFLSLSWSSLSGDHGHLHKVHIPGNLQNYLPGKGWTPGTVSIYGKILPSRIWLLDCLINGKIRYPVFPPSPWKNIIWFMWSLRK